MKKSSLFVFIFLLFIHLGHAQSLLVDSAIHTLGIHLNSTLNAPVYISYYHVQPGFKNFGVKMGYGQKGNTGYILSQDPGGFGSENLYFDCSYFYVTPLYVPWHRSREGKFILIGLGLPLGFSKDQLKTVDTGDPIFGYYSKTYKENNFYLGVELEGLYWMDLGPKWVLSAGANTGFKAFGKAPFQEKLQNSNKKNTYYPGMYKGIYFNLNLGILYKF